MTREPQEPPRPHGRDTTRPIRTVTAIAAELADVERYLRETPPHNDRGGRDRLVERRARLQRELAVARLAGTS